MSCGKDIEVGSDGQEDLWNYGIMDLVKEGMRDWLLLPVCLLRGLQMGDDSSRFSYELKKNNNSTNSF